MTTQRSLVEVQATLLADARAAIERREPEAADRHYAALLEHVPDSVEALNHLGQRALARGRHEQAVELLARAQGAHLDDPILCANLGLALRAAGRFEEAAAILREAVRLDPDFFIARLHLARVYEDLGHARESIAAYYGAVTTAQGRGRWISDDTTAPSMRPLVQHALRVIDDGRARMYWDLIEPLRARHGADALRRVEKCMAIYLGSMPADWPDPRQKPSFLYFPDLPTQPWFGRELFPWYDAFEAQTAAIRAELERVLEAEQGFESFLKVTPGRSTHEHLTGLHGDPAWDGFFFYRHGKRYEENCLRCPRTATALDTLPLVRLPGHAPECLYSKLTPGSHIRPHRGVTNTRLVTHLPLIVPGNGALRVGGEDHVWQEGRCVTFDDTYLHEAWNHSERTRVVVLLDVWNPFLTEVEVIACTELVLAISDFNRQARLADPMQDKGHG